MAGIDAHHGGCKPGPDGVIVDLCINDSYYWQRNAAVMAAAGVGATFASGLFLYRRRRANKNKQASSEEVETSNPVFKTAAEKLRAGEGVQRV